MARPTPGQSSRPPFYCFFQFSLVSPPSLRSRFQPIGCRQTIPMVGTLLFEFFLPPNPDGRLLSVFPWRPRHVPFCFIAPLDACHSSLVFFFFFSIASGFCPPINSLFSPPAIQVLWPPFTPLVLMPGVLICFSPAIVHHSPPVFYSPRPGLLTNPPTPLCVSPPLHPPSLLISC